ncbi:1899_t:CDS:2, partial [Scutellospora calospora]
KLKDEQFAEYKKYFMINAPRETQWNSYFYVCLSFLRSQKILQILAIKFELSIVETYHARIKLKLKCKVYEIISSANFWTNIHDLLNILQPYYIILNKLQSDKAQLHQVILSLAFLAQFWENYDDL